MPRVALPADGGGDFRARGDPAPGDRLTDQRPATTMPSGTAARYDVNAVIGELLRDLAFAQASQQKMYGYKRAAAAILALPEPLTDRTRPEGSLPRIPGIGPGSTRIIREVLDTGGSPTVELAVAQSERRSD